MRCGSLLFFINCDEEIAIAYDFFYKKNHKVNIFFFKSRALSNKILNKILFCNNHRICNSINGISPLDKEICCIKKAKKKKKKAWRNSYFQYSVDLMN
jgi:hypothetical protein